MQQVGGGDGSKGAKEKRWGGSGRGFGSSGSLVF